jgi:hypothetical protein
VNNVLGKLDTLFKGIDAIEAIAKQALGDTSKDAFEALHVIAVVVGTLREGFADKLTVEQVEAEIKSLRKTLLDNDEAADQALHDKFDKT